MVRSVLQLLVACRLWSTVHSFLVDYTEALACDRVGVAWTRAPESETHELAFPLYLNIVPLNSTPIIKQIQEWSPNDDAGVEYFDFPYPPNVSFVLGVTDSNGHGVGKTSCIKVSKSPEPPGNQTSCSSPSNSRPGDFRALSTKDEDPDKCPSVNVSWTNSLNPSIFFFAPGHTPLKMEGGDTSGSVKTPHGTYTSFSEVVVMFKDPLGAFAPDRLIVGGQDKPSCASNDIISIKPDFNPLYRPHVASLIIGFVLAGVVVLFILVFLIFWHCRRREKVRDIESTPPPPSPSVMTEKTASLSLSMRTDRDFTEPIQMSAVETTTSDGLSPDTPPIRRRPNLEVRIPQSPIPPVPPVPESLKTGSGSISEPPETGRTDTSRGRGIRKKQNTPNSDRKRQGANNVKTAPSSFSLTTRSSSKAALRKASLVSDATTTTEDNTFPEVEPRPDSPTLPDMYLGSKRSSRIRKLRRSRSQLSNRSSRRSHRDYTMLPDDGAPNDSATPTSATSRRLSLPMLSKTRSRSLPRS